MSKQERARKIINSTAVIKPLEQSKMVHIKSRMIARRIDLSKGLEFVIRYQVSDAGNERDKQGGKERRFKSD